MKTDRDTDKFGAAFLVWVAMVGCFLVMGFHLTHSHARRAADYWIDSGR